MKLKSLLLAGALAVLALGPAMSAGFLTNGLPVAGSVPLTLPLTGAETVPADTNLTQGLNPASEAITLDQLAGGLGGMLDGSRNKLIGGDFYQNLWQRGTTGASTTTALLYGADRWWGLSGTGTAFTQAQGTSSPPTGTGAYNRVQRTAAETGVVAVCVGQVLSSANSYSLAGQTVEFSFDARAGALFSAANSTITATIAYGTGANGSAANFSTGSWTGYAVATAQAIVIGTSFERFSAVAAIPATAAQVGVKICYTPVGTAGATDYFDFARAQLAVNPGAVAKTNLAATDTSYSMLGFDARQSNVEADLQRSYYWKLAESATITPLAACAAIDITHTNCLVQFPVQMRITPTITYTAGFASPTSTTQATLGACSALATAVTVTSATLNPNNVLVTCTATTIPAAGVASFLYSNGGSGVIQASAEL